MRVIWIASILGLVIGWFGSTSMVFLGILAGDEHVGGAGIFGLFMSVVASGVFLFFFDTDVPE